MSSSTASPDTTSMSSNRIATALNRSFSAGTGSQLT
jgi:hypothetical protein